MLAKEWTITQLEAAARRIRRRVVGMSHAGRAPHLGSSLSCIDLLVGAYGAAMNIDPQQPNAPWRDRLILSKGHAAAALYATLAEHNFFPDSWLDDYALNGSRLPEQPSPNCAPGVEAATGSLGHGLSLGAGMALANRIKTDGEQYHVFVVLSDGECNEGSVWEAAMFAPAQRLTNLTAIIDYNKWQATGRSEEVLALHPLADKWRAFGWHTVEIDGHDMTEITKTLSDARNGEHTQPTAIIAHTVKGKGVSFMEDDNNWHYRVPSDEELAAANNELTPSLT